MAVAEGETAKAELFRQYRSCQIKAVLHRISSKTTKFSVRATQQRTSFHHEAVNACRVVYSVNPTHLCHGPLDVLFVVEAIVVFVIDVELRLCASQMNAAIRDLRQGLNAIALMDSSQPLFPNRNNSLTCFCVTHSSPHLARES